MPPQLHRDRPGVRPPGRSGTSGGCTGVRASVRSAWLWADAKVSPYAYIAPFFIVFGLIGLFPVIYTFYVSFFEWNLIGGQGEAAGAANYLTVLADARFQKALVNTVSIFALSTIPQVIAAVAIAYALDANLRARTFWRMGVLVPYVVAPVAVALIFSKLFADQSGVINAMLEMVGVDAVGWHSDRFWSHVAIATMVNFRWTGYNALILLAAFQAIPHELHEAAVVDGASRARHFFSVTVPMLRPTLIFVILTSTIGGLQIFDEPRMYDVPGQGGNDGQWLTATVYIYNMGWRQLNMGQAAAASWVLFLVIVAFGLVNFFLTRRIASADGTSRRRRKKGAS